MGKVVFSTITAATLAISCAGCGKSNGLYPVYGKVLYRGQPATGATVYFHRKGSTDRVHEQVSMGVVQEDGAFKLVGPGGEGVSPGEYIVLVEWKEGAGKVRGRNPGLNAPDRFKGRYVKMNQPLLHAEIKATKNQLSPFELN
jgi:hypothetical protein